MSETQAAAIAARFPVGNIAVRFDPQHPESAVLLTGNNLDKLWRSTYWGAATCIGAVVLTIVCLVSAAKAERRVREKPYPKVDI
jgi:hypothetical protein